MRVRETTLGPRGRVSRVAIGLGIGAIVVVAVGVWLVLNQGLGVLYFYSVLLTALLASFVFVPTAASYGRTGEGALTVWLALFFGPFSLLILIPWFRRLPERSRETGAG